MIVANNGINAKTSSDLRQRVVDAMIGGASIADVLRIMNIKEHTVRRIWKKYQATGRTDTEQRGGYKQKM